MQPKTALTKSILHYLFTEWQQRFGNVDPCDFQPDAATCEAVKEAFAAPEAKRTTEQMEAGYDVMAPFADQLALLDPAETVHHIIYLMQAIDRERPRIVIDAGCGVGLPLAWLAMSFPQVTFLGYDLSAKTVERANERLRRLVCRNAEVVKCSHSNAPDLFGYGVTELVFCKNAHLKPPQLAPVSATVRNKGLLLHLQPLDEDKHQTYISRGRLFGLNEELGGRSCVPEPNRSIRLGKPPPFSFKKPPPMKLTDTLALRKNLPQY